ncbi:hypothetical protein C8Q76DRAFT_790990 [Earliella scabrosa]|nr:hypothetical protein C8Q76DRAFT_790990 [Earliella scabrosa]
MAILPDSSLLSPLCTSRVTSAAVPKLVRLHPPPPPPDSWAHSWQSFSPRPTIRLSSSGWKAPPPPPSRFQFQSRSAIAQPRHAPFASLLRERKLRYLRLTKLLSSGRYPTRYTYGG